MNWPERYAEFWLRNPRPTVSPEGAMFGLELLIKNAKEQRKKEHDAREGDESGKLEYLRGPLGQRDRDTLYKSGKGTIGGEGGFLNDKPKSD